MRKRLERVWNAIRQALAIRGLLQWLGLWKHIPVMLTGVASVALGWWGHLRGLPAPNIVLLVIVCFFLLTFIGAIILNLVLPRKLPPEVEDLGGLKGRVMRLRDDIQDFLNETGDKPKTERNVGMTEAEYDTARLNDGLIWSDKLSHGFALRFTERAKRIFHECGEAGTTHTMFGLRIAKEYVQKSDILEMIDDLTWLANNVD